MRLRNVRYMPINVGGKRLRKGTSVQVQPGEITSRIQILINKGYLVLEGDASPVKVVQKQEADQPAPAPEPVEEPAPEPAPEPVEEPAPVVEEEPKPKITRKRKKKASTPKE